jgi:hypothetical protein
MSNEKLKSTTGKMANFCKNHKTAIILGIQALQNEKKLRLLEQEFLRMNESFEAYKDKVLYEQALDYASK